AESELNKLRKRKITLLSEITPLENKLADIPTRKEIEGKAKRLHMIAVAKARNAEIGFTMAEAFPKMSYDDKRGLNEKVFSGDDTDGKRRGVYVTKGTGDAKWTFNIRGILVDIEDDLPMSDKRKNLLLGTFDPAIDLESSDFVRTRTRYAQTVRQPPPDYKRYS